VPPIEIPDFTKGKRTRRGRPLPPNEMPEPFPVVAIPCEEIDAVIGARNVEERRRFLRQQKLLGRLVTDEGRLTQRVRVGEGRRVRMYVFRDSVPCIRLRSNRVFFW
jgi:hypothetical protein